MRHLLNPAALRHLLAAATLLLLLTVCAGAALVLAGPVPLAAWWADPGASFILAQGGNPAPVILRRPQATPLSPLAQLGRSVFFDAALSASGRLACAGCHSPQHAYGPPRGDPAMFGGPGLDRQGQRAVPSLMYLDQQPPFAIGPDSGADDLAPATPRATKTAQDPAQAAANLVPQGGLFWDGRAATLQDQALGPLLNPVEMDNASVNALAARLRAAPYGGMFATLFGPQIDQEPALLVAEAMLAVARFETEDPSFHPYSSKYDAWLEGRARLSPAQMRGYLAFNDPDKGNCAGCHLDTPLPDGSPPLFTDHQFEALGVPRNPELAANANPAYFDLGLCGPTRTDLATQTQYCGMFLTPTLRNVATRQVFFHNGAYHSLAQVLDFYALRDVAPARIYPLGPDGRVQTFDDLPGADVANIDTQDPPFDRHAGERPAMSRRDEADIIAFLQTLTDGDTR